MLRYKSMVAFAPPKRTRGKNINATESKPYTLEELAGRRAAAKQNVDVKTLQHLSKPSSMLGCYLAAMRQTVDAKKLPLLL